MRTTFTSKNSFSEAEYKARMSGFKPVGKARNQSGLFVVFAEKSDNRKGQAYSFM